MLRTLIFMLLPALLAGCISSELKPPHLDRYLNPRQGALHRDVPVIPTKVEEKLRPRASFEVEVYVMSKKRYRMDPLSAISQYDFALAWGPAATAAVQAALTVKQEDRSFDWKLKEESKGVFLSRSAVTANIANMHFIAGNDAVSRTLDRVAPGDSLRAKGMLVDIFNDTVGERVTSLSRTDEGYGSSEIFYITELEVL